MGHIYNDYLRISYQLDFTRIFDIYILTHKIKPEISNIGALDIFANFIANCLLKISILSNFFYGTCQLDSTAAGHYYCSILF